jgi:hypothetical protein
MITLNVHDHGDLEGAIGDRLVPWMVFRRR